MSFPSVRPGPGVGSEAPAGPPPVQLVLPAGPGRRGVDLRDFYQDKREILGIICHHSAGPASATVDSVRRFHTAPPPEGRGWSDIGYHAVIRWDGEAWSMEHGRPVERMGAHDDGQNQGTFGLCLFGNHAGNRPVPAPAWAMLVEAVAGLLVLYQLPDRLSRLRPQRPPRGGRQPPRSKEPPC